MWISIFYDARTDKCEQIMSSDGFTKQQVVEYIDNFCPPEKRSVNGKDSLRMKRVNSKDLVNLIEGRFPVNLPVVRGGMMIVRSDASGKIVPKSDYRQKW